MKKQKGRVSTTLRVLRILADNGRTDYRDGNIPCTYERFKESIKEVSEKTGVPIVRLGNGIYVVTKASQKILQVHAKENSYRDCLFIAPHPRWKQLKIAVNVVKIEEKKQEYDYIRLYLIIIGTMLTTLGLVSFYFSVYPNS